VSLRREYRGFGLYLRYPASLDVKTHQSKLPVRLAITHTFSFRRFDGAPEPRYNETLEEFDTYLTGFFRDSARGQIVLVETFGGKRNYYFYLADAADGEQLLNKLRARFPGHRVEATVKPIPSGGSFVSTVRSSLTAAANVLVGLNSNHLPA